MEKLDAQSSLQSVNPANGMPFNAVLFEQRVTQALQHSPKPETTNCLGFVWWCLDLADTEVFISPHTSGDYLFQYDTVPFQRKKHYSFAAGYLGIIVALLPSKSVVHAAVLHPSRENILVHRKGYNSKVEAITIPELISTYEKSRQAIYEYFLFMHPRN